ncbi:MAG: hypothetical protein H0X46_03960 [Bacteroidetes bacterium]|nr:hypothetical protein [Bacteroidota bacterium]
MKQTNYSRYSLIFLLITIATLFFYFDLWKKNRIIVDAPSYYTYLPAVIIHHDLHLNYLDQDPAFFKNKVWYYNIENNKKLIKHPMGISVMLSPFFIIGHWIAGAMNYPQDGYSMPYQNAVSIGVLIYLFIGLHYLRKLLLNFFSEEITALTLIAIVLGTNLLWYSTFEGLMPHAITFSLWCIALYSFYNWLKDPQRKFILIFSAVFGLIVLIRPLSIVGILYFILYGIFDKGSIAGFYSFVKTHFKSVVKGAVIAFLIASLQLLYWKYATGHWLYDVYRDEHFVLNSPQILPFLFSFRKGIFIYTPILIFMLIGLARYFNTNKAIFWSTVLFMSLTIYLLSSWWAWSYGISWGIRPMIDYYPLLSLPLAAGFQFALKSSRAISWCCGALIFLMIMLNLFQTWQYKNGLIHYDDMSREAYFKGFFQTKPSVEWADLLKPYEWERRMKNLPQNEYGEALFNSLDKTKKISLRGSNLLFVTINEKAQNAMGALSREATGNGMFSIEHIAANQIRIRSENGLYWSLKPQFENVITASETTPAEMEMFTFEYIDADDNRIAIKAANGKFITTGEKWPFILKAGGEEKGKNELFRYYIIEK